MQHKGKIGSRTDNFVKLCRVFLPLSGLQRSMVDQVDLARRPALERLAMMRQSLPARIRACPQPRGCLGQPALTDEIALSNSVLL